MIAALAVTAVTAVILAAVIAWQNTRPGLLASRGRRRVVITLKSGDAFDGVLYEVDHDCVILRNATALSYGPDHEHVTVEGEAVILRPDIAYIQMP